MEVWDSAEFWATYSVLVLLGSVVVLVVGAWLGNKLGKEKGRGTLGGWLGFLLGPLGWLIIAVLEPTDQERQRRAALTVEVAGQAVPRSAYLPAGVRVVSQQEAVAEALRRDPSLADTADPDAMRRLSEAVPLVQQELQLKAQVDAMHAAQQAEVEQARHSLGIWGSVFTRR